jgi:hypothetical protein
MELQKASETGSELKILKSTVGNVERCMSKENLSQMVGRDFIFFACVFHRFLG